MASNPSGRTKMKHEDVVGLVEKHMAERGGMISLLEGIQGKFGYLPDEALSSIRIPRSARRPPPA